MLWMCCCANERKEGGDIVSGLDSKLKSARAVNVEFISLEGKIGL